MFVKDYNLTRSLEKTYCVRKCKRNEYREFDHSGTLNIRGKHLLAEDVNLTFFFFFFLYSNCYPCFSLSHLATTSFCFVALIQLGLTLSDSTVLCSPSYTLALVLSVMFTPLSCFFFLPLLLHWLTLQLLSTGIRSLAVCWTFYVCHCLGCFYVSNFLLTLPLTVALLSFNLIVYRTRKWSLAGLSPRFLDFLLTSVWLILFFIFSLGDTNVSLGIS